MYVLHTCTHEEMTCLFWFCTSPSFLCMHAWIHDARVLHFNRFMHEYTTLTYIFVFMYACTHTYEYTSCKYFVSRMHTSTHDECTLVFMLTYTHTCIPVITMQRACLQRFLPASSLAALMVCAWMDPTPSLSCRACMHMQMISWCSPAGTDNACLYGSSHILVLQCTQWTLAADQACLVGSSSILALQRVHAHADAASRLHIIFPSFQGVQLAKKLH
jgi:hypothetical protein